ncbi:hypothetical protein L1F06_014425 [Ectopseudomonas hydrolytica]|uniref:Uncharacterized protein n=1 Tax=Ectopseudomonas hydrolytica TaxID=2493633 RepID=A0ABY5A2A6_9GAMM|nr:hypothetical protein [Pseudomonas hydrolytica]USR37872.1 hypothetical protein L1F06_014425 [Pseudomonas hydrolytica]
MDKPARTRSVTALKDMINKPESPVSVDGMDLMLGKGAVRVGGDTAFLLISNASGVLVTENWQELQYDSTDISSVHLAIPGLNGLSVEEVRSVSVFEELRPTGGIRHHVSYTLMGGSIYTESELSSRATGKHTTVYEKR